MTFEEQFRQLQQLTGKLEQEALPLEEAMAIYQKGLQLSEACEAALQQAAKQFTLTTEAEKKEETSE